MDDGGYRGGKCSRGSRKTIIATKHTIYRSQKNITKTNRNLWELDQSVTVANRKNALTAKSTVTEQRGPQNFVCLQMKRISTKLHH